MRGRKNYSGNEKKRKTERERDHERENKRQRKRSREIDSCTNYVLITKIFLDDVTYNLSE